MKADQIIEDILGKEGGYVDHPLIKAGQPAGASRKPQHAHMATPVICETCQGNSKANPAERLLDRPRFDPASLSRYWQRNFATPA